MRCTSLFYLRSRIITLKIGVLDTSRVLKRRAAWHEVMSISSPSLPDLAPYSNAIYVAERLKSINNRGAADGPHLLEEVSALSRSTLE